MKKVVITLFAAFMALSLSAQDNLLTKGEKVVNVGIGFGGYGTWGYSIAVPPISGSFEIGVKDDVLDVGSIGVGGYIAYASYKQNNYSGDSYWTFNRLVIGARGVFHYPLVEKLDTYTGLMLGFSNYSWKWNGPGDQPVDLGGSPIGISWFAGGRYYFNEKIAGMAEIGYGITYLNLGVAFKL